MKFSTSVIVAALGLASTTTALAVPSRDSCSLFPWFIAPYAHSNACTGTVATYQPTSGPYNPNAGNSGCRSLSDPSGPQTGFGSVSINRDACPQQPWKILLYTDAHCATRPTVVNSDVCVGAPGWGTRGGSVFLSFEAVRVN